MTAEKKTDTNPGLPKNDSQSRLNKKRKGEGEKGEKQREKSRAVEESGMSKVGGERSRQPDQSVEVHGRRGDVGAGQSENWSRGKGFIFAAELASIFTFLR